MIMLNGIENFLHLVDANWTTILVIVGLVLSIGKKTKDYFSKSKEEQIAIAKLQIQESMLKMITEAEIDFETWSQAGSIKRSQVIQEIYERYPVLSKVADQKQLIDWIDEEIKGSLKTLRKVVEENNKITE